LLASAGNISVGEASLATIGALGGSVVLELIDTAVQKGMDKLEDGERIGVSVLIGVLTGVSQGGLVWGLYEHI
jgi:hypothetical protein